MNSYSKKSQLKSNTTKTVFSVQRSLLDACTLLIVIFFCSFQKADAMVEYPTYPTPAFHNVEKICREILIDIHALSFNNDLYDAWLKKSDYMLNQFLILTKTIDELVNNPEECRSFLLEDLYYLNEIICLVEQSSASIFKEQRMDLNSKIMRTMIQEGKSKLESLFHLNQETIS